MTIAEKEMILAGLKASFNISCALLDSKMKYASLVQKCDLIKEKIDLIQNYAAQVSEVCHGKR